MSPAEERTLEAIRRLRFRRFNELIQANCLVPEALKIVEEDLPFPKRLQDVDHNAWKRKGV